MSDDNAYFENNMNNDNGNLYQDEETFGIDTTEILTGNMDYANLPDFFNLEGLNSKFSQNFRLEDDFDDTSSEIFRDIRNFVELSHDDDQNWQQEGARQPFIIHPSMTQPSYFFPTQRFEIEQQTPSRSSEAISISDLEVRLLESSRQKIGKQEQTETFTLPNNFSHIAPPPGFDILPEQSEAKQKIEKEPELYSSSDAQIESYSSLEHQQQHHHSASRPQPNFQTQPYNRKHQSQYRWIPKQAPSANQANQDFHRQDQQQFQPQQIYHHQQQQFQQSQQQQFQQSQQQQFQQSQQQQFQQQQQQQSQQQQQQQQSQQQQQQQQSQQQQQPQFQQQQQPQPQFQQQQPQPQFQQQQQFQQKQQQSQPQFQQKQQFQQQFYHHQQLYHPLQNQFFPRHPFARHPFIPPGYQHPFHPHLLANFHPMNNGPRFPNFLPHNLPIQMMHPPNLYRLQQMNLQQSMQIPQTRPPFQNSAQSYSIHQQNIHRVQIRNIFSRLNFSTGKFMSADDVADIILNFFRNHPPSTDQFTDHYYYLHFKQRQYLKKNQESKTEQNNLTSQNLIDLQDENSSQQASNIQTDFFMPLPIWDETKKKLKIQQKESIRFKEEQKEQWRIKEQILGLIPRSSLTQPKQIIYTAAHPDVVVEQKQVDHVHEDQDKIENGISPHEENENQIQNNDNVKECFSHELWKIREATERVYSLLLLIQENDKLLQLPMPSDKRVALVQVINSFKVQIGQTIGVVISRKELNQIGEEQNDVEELKIDQDRLIKFLSIPKGLKALVRSFQVFSLSTKIEIFIEAVALLFSKSYPKSKELEEAENLLLTSFENFITSFQLLEDPTLFMKSLERIIFMHQVKNCLNQALNSSRAKLVYQIFQQGNRVFDNEEIAQHIKIARNDWEKVQEQFMILATN